VALLFALSGAAALMVEIVWQHWFRLLLGATAPATSATLVAFFAGQALGALLGARLAGRLTRDPGQPTTRKIPRSGTAASRRVDGLRFYAKVELVAAGTALAVPWLLGAGEALLPFVYDPLLEQPVALTGVRFLLVLVVSLPTSVAFGASFPAAAAAALEDSKQLGSRGTVLYGANLVGAVVGTVLGSFVLPERVGVPVTYGLAVAGSACVGVAALLLSRRRALEPTRKVRESARSRPRKPRPEVAPASGPMFSAARLRAFAIFSGFGTLALQVLLVHALGLVLDQSIYAFGLVLLLVLASLALGAFVVALFDRTGLADARSGLVVALVAATLLLAALPAILVGTTSGLEYVGSDAPWPGYLLAALRVAATCAGPVLLATALIFPFVLALAARAPGSDAASALGPLLALNTAGAILGALLAPFVLLPTVGPWLSFSALAALYALASLFVPLPNPHWRLRRDIALGLGWMIVLARGNPLSLPVVGLPADSLLEVRHSAAGTIAVALRDGERLLQVDNHYSLGGTAERTRAERQGHLPLLLVPGARSVAYLGSATGISAGAATQHAVTHIVTVELVPGVASAAARYFRDANQDVFDDPRTRVVVDDARNFLRMTRRSFDVIVADLFVPWRAGTGSLYAREHFQAGRERLAPGGVFCQWLPLYQLSEQEFRIVSASFLDVFPDSAVFRGDFYGRFPIVALCGWPDGAPAPDRVARESELLRAGGELDRWLIDPSGFWALYVGALGSLRDSLLEVPRQSDDHPVLEYRTARGHGGGGGARSDALVGMAWLELAEQLRRADDPLRLALPHEARASIDGGAALQAAGVFFAAGRGEEASRALAAASELIPRRLLAEAPADPTAAEVWTE
jgi:spermidine synthase